MEITVEISYYPLTDNYKKPVDDFIKKLSGNNRLIITPGVMSSMISGGYDDVMKTLTDEIKPFMEKYPSVFTLKIANACKTCSEDQ